LVDHIVRLVDEVEALIEEEGWHSLDKYKSSSHEEIIQALTRHEKVAEVAFLELMRRRIASRPSAAAVRKEPITFACDTADEAAYFADMLQGTEPCLAEITDAPGVVHFSIKCAWPPTSRPRCYYPSYAYIASCHRSLFLICLSDCGAGLPAPYRDNERGFHMVYNTGANSAAIVPRVSGVSFEFHRHIARDGAGGAVVTLRPITTRDPDAYLIAPWRS